MPAEGDEIGRDYEGRDGWVARAAEPATEQPIATVTFVGPTGESVTAVYAMQYHEWIPEPDHQFDRAPGTFLLDAESVA